MHSKTPRTTTLFLGLVVSTLVVVGWPAHEDQEVPAPNAPAPAVKPESEPAQEAAMQLRAAPESGAARWTPANSGLSMEIPSGWSPTLLRGRAYLRRDMTAPLEGNFNLLVMPNMFGLDLARVLEENRAELERNPQFHLDAIAQVELGGRQVVRIDYRGTPQGKDEEMRFTGIVYLRGRNQVVLTATARAAVWPEIADAIEQAIRSLAISP